MTTKKTCLDADFANQVIFFSKSVKNNKKRQQKTQRKMNFYLESNGLARFMKLRFEHEFTQLLEKADIKLTESVGHEGEHEGGHKSKHEKIEEIKEIEEIEEPGGDQTLQQVIANLADDINYRNTKDCTVSDENLITFIEWFTRVNYEFSLDRKTQVQRALDKAYEEWLSKNSQNDSVGWRCKYIQDCLDIADITVLSLSGIGAYSIVAIVLYDGKRQAMRVTRRSYNTPDEEYAIQTLLADANIAPKIIKRITTDEYNVEIMQEVVTTLRQFLQRIQLNEKLGKELGDSIFEILTKLAKVGVIHGDGHLQNWGLTAEGKLLIFDFDNSSRRLALPTFDIAILYGALVPESYPFNRNWVIEMRRVLFKNLDGMWKTKSGDFNDDYVQDVRELWSKLMKDPSPGHFQELKSKAPKLERKPIQQ